MTEGSGETRLSDQWQEFVRRQAEFGDAQLLDAVQILKRARKTKDLDLLAAVEEKLNRAHIHLFEIHTGTGKA